jgi:hypothetical protein
MIDEKGNIQDWARKVDIEKRSEERSRNPTDAIECLVFLMDVGALGAAN